MVINKGFPGGPVHMIGIGGYGMRGLARLFSGEGRRVSGSDAAASPAVERLREEGMECTVGTDRACVPGDASFVVYSAAVPASDPELAEAHRRELPCYKYSDALGRFCRNKTVIACAGTHGKSTTTALLSFLLRTAGIPAGYVVGADPAGGMEDFTLNAAGGDPMVIEACEYDCSFQRFAPESALITNVEREHVDCFPTDDVLFDAFGTFVDGVKTNGVLVSSRRVIEELLKRKNRSLVDGRIRFVSVGSRGDWRIKQRSVTRYGQTLCVRTPEGEDLPVKCPLPGVHNAYNLLGVLALAAELYGLERIRPALAALDRYKGIDRRFEIKWRGESVVVDDYAHHPAEVKATLEAAGEAFAGMKRLVAVFQPHQRLRLRTFLQRFQESLECADHVFVTPVFAAREPQDKCISDAQNFARRLQNMGKQCTFFPGLEEARDQIVSFVEAGDVVVFLGAGDVTFLSGECAAGIAGKEKMYDKEQNQVAR